MKDKISSCIQRQSGTINGGGINEAREEIDRNETVDEAGVGDDGVPVFTAAPATSGMVGWGSLGTQSEVPNEAPDRLCRTGSCILYRTYGFVAIVKWFV
jgi:hypothetical protein